MFIFYTPNITSKLIWMILKPPLFVFKLDGVGPVDNRPSTD